MRCCNDSPSGRSAKSCDDVLELVRVGGGRSAESPPAAPRRESGAAVADAYPYCPRMAKRALRLLELFFHLAAAATVLAQMKR